MEHKIEIFPPEEIKDKNGVFTYCIELLRKAIGADERFEGHLLPLGNLELCSLTEAMKFLGMDNTNSFYYNIRQYNKQYPERIIEPASYTNLELKRGPFYLKKDLVPLNFYIKAKSGTLPFEDLK